MESYRDNKNITGKAIQDNFLETREIVATSSKRMSCYNKDTRTMNTCLFLEQLCWRQKNEGSSDHVQIMYKSVQKMYKNVNALASMKSLYS